ncbi:calcium uniporter protein, mitochondrial-like [Gigantopelta aegis]|uniref:calcium uniporter protein, mitochondrial-like n=1 Tax=Gigantopelta aegis TaxID=1735272 RepID=UPI001B8891CF|nr:calcium uniporter protein, mitochondrial-like [Gigantopelta aegis]
MASAPFSLLLRRSFCKQFMRKRTQIVSAIFTENNRLTNSSCPCYFYCTQVLLRSDVTVKFSDGLPVLSVPLPSRRELCEFTLKPVSHTVGDLVHFIKDEDGGIDRASVYTTDGNRIAKSTTIDVLLRSDFKLVINDETYLVSPPKIKPVLHEDADTLSDVKSLIAQLYSTLNVEHYQIDCERELQQKLEDLKVQLAPFEKKKEELAANAHRNTRLLTWVGLGLMSLQFGVLARLTWWEYSWDIMEPVTYFVTYGTSMAMYAYFVLTRQEYIFPSVVERQYLIQFYKKAKNQKLDVEKYNELKNAISQIEHDLRRLRDPLQLHLPISELPKLTQK